MRLNSLYPSFAVFDSFFTVMLRKPILSVAIRFNQSSTSFSIEMNQFPTMYAFITKLSARIIFDSLGFQIWAGEFLFITAHAIMGDARRILEIIKDSGESK